MNRKGFTLVELLATIVVLAIVVGISVPSVTGIIRKSKEKSEMAFIETIKDAMDVYISSSARTLNYNTCGGNTNYEYINIEFQDVIDIPYHPISIGSLMNPANNSFCTGKNEKRSGKNIITTPITIYRNKITYAYYYIINKKDFYSVDVLTDGDDTLNQGSSSDICFEFTVDNEYISNKINDISDELRKL